MANVGDRFVIKIKDIITNEEGETFYFIDGFKTLMFDDYGLSHLVSYSEAIQSDCNRARREGFLEGHTQGYNDGTASRLAMDLETAQNIVSEAIRHGYKLRKD